MADLHFGDAAPSEPERAAVEVALAATGTGGGVTAGATDRPHERVALGGVRRRKAVRHLLLPVLHELQHQVGWISPGAVNHVGETLGVPPAEVYGVATFYDMLNTEQPERLASTYHVCVDPVCAIGGAQEKITALREAGHQAHAAPCLGQCHRPPAVYVQGLGEPDWVPADLDAPAAPVPQASSDPAALQLLRRMGEPPGADLSRYLASGGGEALRRAMELGSTGVLDALQASGLSGRGGAAFPTGVKWRAVAERSGGPAHVVANADESEPGTFKDRVVMEYDPHALLEAMTVAGVTVGAENGWVYIRGEYPTATTALNEAIEARRAAGLLGEDAAGSGQRFDVELRRGAGAYICGEETALFNSLEGFRGEPRSKPPFPTTHGLFGEPTVVNNPETLLGVLEVLTQGVEQYRSLGTERSPGTKLFCLAGRVGVPGLYEVPFGTRLGELVELAGGCTGELRAILLGGAAGSFVGPDALDLPLTLEDTAAAGTTLGSGPVMVFDSTVDMRAAVRRLAQFFADESCGQCVPCRVGTVRQVELLDRRPNGARAAGQSGDASVTGAGKSGAASDTTTAAGQSGGASNTALLGDVAAVMGDASICGLGHTAASAVQSALRLGLLD